MKVLKGLLLFLVYALVTLVILAVAASIVLFPRIRYEWDWFSCFLLLFGIVGAGWLVRWLVLARRREQARAFVEGVTEISSPQLAALQQQATSLRKSWQRAMEELLRFANGKNAVYEFPWYVVLGARGSGKTEVLRRSRLRANLENAGQTDAASPFELLVLKNAVFLDINGRLVDTPDESGLWPKLAAQICRRRPKEPVNGILVTVPALLLAKGLDGEISAQAQKLRDAIEVLQGNSQHRLPVYLVVTQIDRLPGMARLGRLLPEERRRQAMGVLNDDQSPAREFAARAAGKLCNAMSDLRVEMLYNFGDDSGLVLLPGSTASLGEGLKSFAGELLDFPRPEECPPLRGIFLTSATQEDGVGGIETEICLREMGYPLPKAADAAPAEGQPYSEPLFVYDFLSRVLTAGRWLYSPLPHYARVQSLRRSLPLLAFLCASFIACLLLVMSFLRQSVMLKNFHKNFFSGGLSEKGSASEVPMVDALAKLNALSGKVDELKGLNSGAWWSLLRQSFVLQEQMERGFVGMFRKTIVTELDSRMKSVNFAPAPDIRERSQCGAYFDYLVSRISLDRLTLAGQMTPAVFDRLPDPAGATLAITLKDFPADSAKIMSQLYQRYYLWGDSQDYLRQDAQTYSSILVRLIEQDPTLLQTIIDWINADAALSDITLEEFWGGDPYRRRYPNVMIGRAYTTQGKQRLLSFLTQLQQTVDQTPMNDPQRQRVNALLQAQQTSLATWYNMQVYNVWLAFMRNFPLGMENIPGEEALTLAATQSAMMQGPYLRLIERCGKELPQFSGNNYLKMPVWLRLVMRIREWRLQAPFNSVIQNSAMIQQSKSFLSNIIDSARNPGGSALPATAQSTMQPATLFALYQQSLAQAAPVDGPLSRKETYNSLKAVYAIHFPDASQPDAAAAAAVPAPAAGAKPDQKNKLPPLEGAWQSLRDLKKSVSGEYGSDPACETVWRLLQGEMDLLMKWYCYQSAEYLQSTWNSAVLAVSAQSVDAKRTVALFDSQNGFVWQWQKSVASPFLARNTDGDFVNNQLYGQSLPIRPEILRMLNVAAKGAVGIQGEYTVNVSCLPTDVNPRSYEMPSSVTLTMYAAAGPQTLKNVNLHASQTFKWKPADGGTVELQINFSSFMLVKRYLGDYGFASFVRDFRGGAQTFTGKDFPQSAQLLKDMNVDWIKVYFSFDPAQIDPILRLFDLFTLQAPTQLVQPLANFLAQDAATAAAK